MRIRVFICFAEICGTLGINSDVLFQYLFEIPNREQSSQSRVSEPTKQLNLFGSLSNRKLSVGANCNHVGSITKSPERMNT